MRDDIPKGITFSLIALEKAEKQFFFYGRA
jgi:hypothetical protein